MGQSTSRSTDPANPEVAVDERLELSRLYHGLARSLEGGTTTRPGLPVELVIYILRLADCTLPCPRLTISTDTPCHARATSGSTNRTVWFSTPPLDRALLSKITRMQLLTVSRDQGWCSDPAAGSWSWFELAILSSQGHSQPVLKRRESNDEELVWVSHRNPIESKDFSQCKGITFGSEHEIWEHLVEGDMIEVRVCARFGGWSNSAQEGILRVDEWFEPTLPPRIR